MCIEGHVRKWNSLPQALTLPDELKSQGSGRESRREEERKEPTRGIRNVNSNRYALARSLHEFYRASLFTDPSHAHFVRQHESRELSRSWRRLPHSSLCAFIIMKPKVLFFHLLIFTGILEISNQGSRKKVFKRQISLLLCLYNGCRSMI